MKSRFLILAMVAVLASLLIASCERPAPLPPTVATATSEIPFPLPNNSTLDTSQIGTMTAVAKTPPVVTIAPTQGQGGQVTENTPVPPQPTEPPPPAPAATNTSRPVIQVPSATPGRPSTYTIEAGDTFYCIARRFNLDVSDFLSLNGLGSNSLAQIGQVVKIPQSGTWDSGERALKDHPATYTVVAGDTLNRIACRFGDVDPSAILVANGMSSANDIKAGLTINIP